jgi:Tfp pilus assembly protein PilO
MSATDTSERRGGGSKAQLLELLHDPLKLRLCLIAVILTGGFLAIFNPLSDQIAQTSKDLKRDTRLLDLARSVEQLRKQYRTFEDRIPQQSDTKEWVQYVLDGIRSFPLKMVKLDCRDPKPIGPYKAIVLQVELEGSFFDVDKFLRWVETNKRLLRVDELKISPGRGGGDVVIARLTLLGLTG